MLISISEILRFVILGIVTGTCANLLSVFISGRVKWKDAQSPKRELTYDLSRSIIIAGYFIALVVFLQQKWIATASEVMFISAGSVIAILGFELIYVLAGQYFKRMTPSPLREVAYLAAFLILLAWVIDKYVPHYVDIECPQLVDSSDIIEGRVINDRWNVRLLIHPIEGTSFFVQIPPVPDQKGVWRTACRFGGSGGQMFEVLAIASPDSIALDTGETLSAREIPQNVYRSSICLATKRSRSK